MASRVYRLPETELSPIWHTWVQPFRVQATDRKLLGKRGRGVCVGPKRIEPSRDGLSVDHPAFAKSDKSGNLTEPQATNQSKGVAPIAASPNIIADHSNGAGNGSLAGIQFRVLVRPGTPLTVARKPGKALPGEGSFSINCTRGSALVERTQNKTTEMPDYMTRSTKARVCTSTGTSMSSNTPRATCSESRRKASSPFSLVARSGLPITPLSINSW